MSTPSAPGPVQTNDLGRGPAIIDVTWTLTMLCILVIVARFYVRKKVSARRAMGVEAWLMLAAVV